MKEFLYLAVSEIKPFGLPKTGADSLTIENILSFIFALIGAIALLVIVISGFRYIISAGDPQKAATAKNGIIYAIVGLVIAVTAQAIVAFVVRAL